MENGYLCNAHNYCEDSNIEIQTNVTLERIHINNECHTKCGNGCDWMVVVHFECTQKDKRN